MNSRRRGGLRAAWRQECQGGALGLIAKEVPANALKDNAHSSVTLRHPGHLLIGHSIRPISVCA
eukprot:737378-Pleurochrysis_carterae.AAC.1